MDMRRWLRALALVVLTSVAAASAQTDFGSWGQRALASPQPEAGAWGRRSMPYDGQFTFVRLRWRGGTYGVLPDSPGPNFWLHEYPRAERNLMGVIDSLTLINARANGSLILAVDDPLLLKHPVAMLWEPGYWTMTDEEAVHLRQYLLKGGFLIVNDFELDQWYNFEAQMRRVLPSGRLLPLNGSHPIFNSFFHLEKIDFPHPRQHHLYGIKPLYFGLFEENDPAKRLMAIVNYNTNLAEYWQMAGTGLFPIDPANEAFKLGVNYMVYALTH
jgi:uncharacterized protein DUF4159